MTWPWRRERPSEREVEERHERQQEIEELRRRIDRIDAQVRVLRNSLRRDERRTA